MARLITLNEKHGERRFLVNTDSDLNRLALKIVKERYEDGLYPTMEQITHSFEQNLRKLLSNSSETPEDRQRFADLQASNEHSFKQQLLFVETLEILMKLPEEVALTYMSDRFAEKRFVALELFVSRAMYDYENWKITYIEDVIGYSETSSIVSS